MTVTRLLAETTSAELSELVAFYGLEPFGPERGDLQAGVVAATVANVNRDPKKQKRPYSVQEFMPKFKGGGGDPAPSTNRRYERWRCWDVRQF